MTREAPEDRTPSRRPYGAVLSACALALLAFPLSSWGLDSYCRVSFTFASPTCSSLTTEILLALFLLSLPAAIVCLAALLAMLAWSRRR